MLVNRRILQSNPPVTSGGITFVSAATTHSGNGTTCSTNWPVGSYKRGDIIIAVYTNSNTSATEETDIGLGPDFVKIVSRIGGATRNSLFAWYKFIDTPFIITASDTKPFVYFSGGAGGGNNSTVGLAQVWRGVDFTKPLDVDPPAIVSSSGTAPNSPSITTVSANCLVFSIAANVVSDATVTAPTGYSNQSDATHADTNPQTGAMASKLVATAGAEDPAVWTNWTAAVYAAATFALRPAKY